MPNLQFTAAKTSRIQKKPPKNISKELSLELSKGLGRHASSLAKTIKKAPPPKEEQLVILDYNVELDYQLPSGSDVSSAVSAIIDNLWSESSKLHSRYFTKEQIAALQPHELIHALRGISATVKNDILQYRKNNLPVGLVTVLQLYSIYVNRGNTFVDKNVELQVRRGRLRKFVITNASPVVLQSLQRYQSGKISYGSEDIEIVTSSDKYSGLLTEAIDKVSEELNKTIDKVVIQGVQLKLDSLKKFKEYIEKNPAGLYIDNENFTKDNFSVLLSFGFLTLTSNHLNEIESHQYAISYPNCGIFLKLINAGRVWLVKLLSKKKYKEILEDALYDKWEGITLSGESKMNNFRKPFYGYDLYWILGDCLGGGIVEVFNTPVGRGWKLTGKV